MQKDRAMTIHFMDGTRVSFDFPEKKTNDAARAIMFEEVLKNPYIMVEADGAVLLYPVANIMSIQLMLPPGQGKVALPKGLIRGATVAS